MRVVPIFFYLLVSGYNVPTRRQNKNFGSSAYLGEFDRL